MNQRRIASVASVKMQRNKSLNDLCKIQGITYSAKAQCMGANSYHYHLVMSDDLRFQNGTSSSEHGGRRYLPYVFTEQGASKMLNCELLMLNGTAT